MAKTRWKQLQPRSCWYRFLIYLVSRTGSEKHKVSWNQKCLKRKSYGPSLKRDRLTWTSPCAFFSHSESFNSIPYDLLLCHKYVLKVFFQVLIFIKSDFKYLMRLWWKTGCLICIIRAPNWDTEILGRNINLVIFYQIQNVTMK